jgi:hypothetical protein
VRSFEFVPLPEDQAKQVMAAFTTSGGDQLADSAVLRNAVSSVSASRLRLLVLRIKSIYAATKILDDKEGFGGRTVPPERTTIGGLPAFYHSDVTPNFLVWQQGLYLALVYGTDRPLMEQLAAGLIAANK